MKTVVLLIPCLSYGGAERQVSLIAPKLSDSNIRVIVISMIQPNAFLSELKDSSIKLSSLGMTKGKYNLYSFYLLINIIIKNKVDYLVTFNFPANFIGRIVKMLIPQIKIITSIRSSKFGSSWRKHFIRITRNMDYKTIPNSVNVANDFIKKGLISPQKLFTINNGINLKSNFNDKRGNEIRKSLECTNKFVWIAVGRHEEAKDYPYLLKTCVLLKENLEHDWHLIIIGGGSKFDESKELILKYKLSEFVTVIGEREDVFSYLLSADAFILSSAWEGMPNALIEAMSVGLPCVATDVGEVPRIIENGVNGFTVRSKNIHDLLDVMIKLMALSKENQNAMGELGQRFVRENFSIDKISEKWLSVLQ